MFVMLATLAAGQAQSGEPLINPESPLLRLDFRDVVKRANERVFPAVVYVKCVRESHEMGKKIGQEVSGSGVLISSAGELLTNWHVVDQAVEVRCLLFDGRAFSARVVGSDKDTDLALVQLQLAPNAEPVPFAPVGDSRLAKEGDFVMAMGAPWGLSRSVAIGIVSCTNRYLPQASEYSLWLQTDAAISPGNSGGPLVNTDGQIIGINSRGTMFGGDMGFAIPSETIGILVSQLREFGHVNWSWTGLQLQPLRDFDANVYFDGNEGVIVSETNPESLARSAGLKVHDRILAVNGTPITAKTTEDLPAIRRMLGLLPKKTPAKFEILRDGQKMTIEITPREKGKVEGDRQDFPRWDFTAKAINEFDNPDLFFHRSKGVFIFGVKQPGNASLAGLQSRDIILKVDEDEIETLEQLKKIHEDDIQNISMNSRVLVTVLRNGLMRQVVLDFSREFEKK